MAGGGGRVAVQIDHERHGLVRIEAVRHVNLPAALQAVVFDAREEAVLGDHRSVGLRVVWRISLGVHPFHQAAAERSGEQDEHHQCRAGSPHGVEHRCRFHQRSSVYAAGRSRSQRR